MRVVVDSNAWGLGWTAVAGLATAVLALFTWRLAKSTRDLAKETDRDVRASWRPVVVPVQTAPGSVQMARIRIKEIDDKYQLRYEVNLTNVGRGPAINCRVLPERPSQGDVGRTGYQVNTVGVGGDVAAGLIGHVGILDAPDWTQPQRLTMRILYEDVGGNPHETELTFRTGQPDPDFQESGLAFDALLVDTKVLALRYAAEGDAPALVFPLLDG